MLSTNAMFKSELDIITVIIWNYCWSPVVCTTNGKRILFLWFLAKPTEHTLWISGSNFRDLDFPSQLCWKFRFGNFDFDSLDSQAQLQQLTWTFLQFLLCVLAPPKMLKTLFVLTSLCIHAHQERGSQLSTWIYPIYPPKEFIQTSARGWDLEKLSLLHTS